eukprot:m.74700 g.74700  ORF g.74700 m.74700 type:complete len:312 (-) comp17121_c0_seq4:48-983(-)
MAIASDQLRVFDRAAKRQQRNRAALRSQYPLACHLRDEIAWQLSDRVNDINRQFLSGLDLGCGTGLLGKHLDQELVKSLVQCDSAAHMLAKFHPQARDLHLRVECDEEALPFAPNTFDLVVSNLSLHWINDLPGTLQQVMKILKPDGVFIASLFGGDTLFELRCALQLAETERHGGFSPRVSPLTEMRDVGSLLQRAGFSLLTVDTDEVTIHYPSAYELMLDLRDMGESSASFNRGNMLRRDTMLAASAIYEAMYGSSLEGTRSIPATFQIIYLIGWKPDPSQPQAAKRGSAERSLKELGVDVDQLVKGQQ